jgi:hypothetical protein
VELPFGINRERNYGKMSVDHSVWEYTHVQFYKLAADPRADDQCRDMIFYGMSVRNHRLSDNAKKIKEATNYEMMSQMEEIKPTVVSELRSKGIYNAEYPRPTRQRRIDDDQCALDEEEIDPLKPPPSNFVDGPPEAQTGEELFIFLLESLERLSFFHIWHHAKDPRQSHRDYRGLQNTVPQPMERWVPIEYQAIIKNDPQLSNLPVYYDYDKQNDRYSPVRPTQVISSFWSLSKIFSGDQFQMPKVLRNSLKMTSMMTSDPDLLNCLLCYPIVCI